MKEKWQSKARETATADIPSSINVYSNIKTKKSKTQNNIADKNHNENLHFHLTCNCELCMVDYNFNVILLFFPPDSEWSDENERKTS